MFCLFLVIYQLQHCKLQNWYKQHLHPCHEVQKLLFVCGESSQKETLALILNLNNAKLRNLSLLKCTSTRQNRTVYNNLKINESTNPQQQEKRKKTLDESTSSLWMWRWRRLDPHQLWATRTPEWGSQCWPITQAQMLHWTISCHPMHFLETARRQDLLLWTAPVKRMLGQTPTPPPW